MYRNGLRTNCYHTFAYYGRGPHVAVGHDKHYYMSKESTVINTILEREDKKRSFVFYEHEKFVELINNIEKNQFDITSVEEDWFRIGCSLANTFGEEGRSYFHTISKYYEGYSVKETDDKFSDCLKNQKKEGYTLGTLFYLANKYGLN